MDDGESPEIVFDGLTFTIIPGGDLGNGVAEKLELTSNGATYLELRDQRIPDLTALTHIISSHTDFPEYSSAIDLGVPVVKPSWVVQCLYKNKIVSPRQHSPDPSQIFQNVIVSIGTLPEYDGDAIVGGVIALGGLYSGPLTRLVTHIVTTDMEHEKCRIAQEKELHCMMVLPHWFDDCLKLGKKINERPYLFPNPEILERDLTSAPRGAPSPQLGGATSANINDVPLPTPPPQTPLSSPSQLRKDLDAFQGRTIMLGSDLNISPHLQQTLEQMILQGGGVATDDVKACDIFIGQYRDGVEYGIASRAKKEVATLSWLYHVINQNRYTNPLNKLLHYPIPREGLQGFENMKISISNYVGDARTYLENLVRYCGGEFTKTMKQDNTHLIVAHTRSEKCEAAQEWNINVINHIWLEESYAKCAVQTLTNPRYNEFPHRTNLSEIVGQTTLDMKKVGKLYFPQARESLQKPISPKVAPKPTSKPSPRKTVPVSSAIYAAAVSTPGNATLSATLPAVDEDAQSQDAESEGTGSEDDHEPKPPSVKKPRGRPKKSTTATPRLTHEDEKENHTHLVMGSGRASKAKALDKLHDQASDIAKYQKEMKRKGGVTHGGRLSSRLDDFVSSPAPQSKKKRKSDEMTYDATAVGSDLSDGETQGANAKPMKKSKTGLPPISYRMMVSSYQKWNDKPAAEGPDRNKLRRLGVQITTDPRKTDILVAPRIVRTRKFVCALASAPLVVGIDYLDSALSKGKLKENPSMLLDRETEEKLGFKLKDSVERAERNQHQLLRGWHIFVTKAIAGTFDTFKEIIEVNGGAAYLWAGRTGTTFPEGVEDDPHAYLVVGDTADDLKLGKLFRDQAVKAGLTPRILSFNWLLNLAMSQQITFEPAWEVVQVL